MGLALITDVRDGPRGHVLEVDTGSNRFVRYAIGTGSQRERGFDELVGVSYESPTRPRIGTGAFQTRFEIEIVSEHLDRRNRYVQIVSFREADGTGPAWSDVVGLVPPITGAGTMSVVHTHPSLTMTRTVPMTVQEYPISGAMAWGQLLGLVDELAPLGQQLLSLVGDEQVQAGASGLIKMLGPLVQQLIGAAGASQPAPTAVPATQPAGQRPVYVAYPGCPPATTPAGSGAGATQPVVPVPAAAAAWGRQPAAPGRLVAPMAIDGGLITGPAVLGLISALGPTVMKAITPLLQKAPEMFQTYMDHPIKFFNAIADVDRQEQAMTNQLVDSMLKQGHQQLLMTLLQGLGAASQTGVVATPAASTQSLRRPGIRTSRAAESLAGSGGTKGPERRVDPRIDATLVPPPPVPGSTKPKSLYAAGTPLTFELVLTTPQAPPNRPIPHVVAHVRITSAASAALVLERRLKLSAVYLNRSTPFTLPLDSVAQLPTGTDLNLSVDVTWTGADGRAYTTPTRAIQNLCIVRGAMVLEPVRRTGTEISLTDPQLHRAFWHKVWEGGSSAHNRWELNVAARYYYVLRGDQPSNGRMETKLQMVEERSKDTGSKVEWGGLLKSGMELSPDALNALLAGVQLPPWSPDELNALRSPVIAEMTSTRASTEIHLRGRTEERGALWVFPVIELVEVDLHRISEIAPSGAVVSTNIAPKIFPLPVATVFVGMENEG